MAVRPIDANWLKNNLNKVFHRECDELYGMMQLIDEAPTLTPQNEWVSVEQLWEMNGVPIWVVDTSINRSEWCYWKDRLAYSCEAPPEYYDPDDYGHWLAYNRLPEAEE